MNSKIVYTLYLMLISPVIGLYFGLKDSSRKVKKALLIIFITIYGTVIFLPHGVDGIVHEDNVYSHYVEMSFEKFIYELTGILIFERRGAAQEDVYIHVLSYFVGGVLGMPQLFFTFVSFIYAYFFIGSIFRVIDLNPSFKYKYAFYGFLIVFVLWKGIEGINTVRTWTGLWVLFYACISYYQTKKVKYALLMFAAPLCHFGYFIMALPAWGVLVMGVRKYLYSVIFLLSFFFNLINPESAKTELEETNEIAAGSVNSYSVEEQASIDDKIEITQGLSWYRQLFKIGIQNYATAFLGVVLIIGGYFFNKMNEVEANIFSIGILTKALSSSTWFLFALSNRSAVIAGIFVMAAFILVAQRGALKSKFEKGGKVENIAFHLTFFALVPMIFIKFAELTELASVFLFVTPFVEWVMTDVNISIKDAVKIILR
jgi:hypothetical protein